MTDEIESPERKRQAAIELANAYREMMATFAWKHLNGVLLKRIVEDVTRNIDQLPIDELTMAQVAEARGVRKCLEFMEAEIGWILNGDTPTTRS